MTEWRKSSRSGTSGNSDCVEVANLTGTIGIRDSKNPSGGHLTLGPSQFAAFLSRVKTDQV